MTTTGWARLRRASPLLLATALVMVLGISAANLALAQTLFVHGTYYLLVLTALCWLGAHLHGAGALTRERAVAWLGENWPGVLVALGVTLIAGLAIEPALRVLSDEANLVGTSKNLFASKTATFTVSGKNYYDSYWDIDVAIDRRPTLFPFLVSLVHSICGYSFKNAFRLNLLLLPAFLLVGYRLAKTLGGETFGIVTALLVAAHPITLLTVRSGGFDFLSALLALLVIQSVSDHLRAPSPRSLAILWMNLCVFAETRYESILFIPPVVGLLLLFRQVKVGHLRPYALLYALTPAFLLPRLWLSLLRGDVPEQDPGTVTFSAQNFRNNAVEYFKPLFSRTETYPAHSAVVIALGLVGCGLWLVWLFQRLRARDSKTPRWRFALLVIVWMLTQVFISFTYTWGRAQYPSAARLFLALDTFFSVAAAWTLCRPLARARPFVPVMLAAAVFAFGVPVASQHRMFNRLTQTRESATTWRFFESLNEKRILIVTDRPSHFTIMDYGAMSFESARSDPYLFTALARRLFYEVYVVQQLKLSTNEPLPGYEIWPTKRLETVFEFQNDADVLVRISRLPH